MGGCTEVIGEPSFLIADSSASPVVTRCCPWGGGHATSNPRQDSFAVGGQPIPAEIGAP
jgi:hypothetical protein